MDAMVDRYYPVVQGLSDSLEELDDLVLENPHPEVRERIRKL
jgi:Mg2+ and Co2+ transporter CorA